MNSPVQGPPTRQTRLERRVANSALGRSNPWIAANALAVLTLVIGASLVVALTAVGAGVYDAVSEQDDVAAFDRPVLDAAIRLRTPTADQVVTWFTHLGGSIGMSVLTAIALAVMVWRWRDWVPPVLVVASAAGSLAMTTAGKGLVGRARPPHVDAVPPFESSPSFPSGHTLNSTVIAGVVAYLVVVHVRRRMARALTVAAALTWIIAMGLSRVFLGHHWLTDVIAAWALGLAWLAVVVTAHRLFLLAAWRREAGRPVG